MSRYVAVVCLGFWSLAISPLRAQTSSDAAPSAPESPVMVLRQEVELKKGTDVVGKASLANILMGREVNGEWLWIPAAKGWIRLADVAPLEKAIDHFNARVMQSPSSQTYYERSAAFVVLGQDEPALADLSKAIELDASNLSALNERGTCYRRLGQPEKAKADFDTLIGRGVKHPAAFTNRGLAWLDLGNTEQAMVDLHVALELNPRFAPAWEASGAAREAMGDIPKAIDDYRVAVEIDPAFALAWNNRAWLLATTRNDALRNGAQAVEFATKACELTGYQKADVLDTLAAALAESRQYEKAVARAKEALAIAHEKQKPAIAQRLALYETGLPFRQ